MIFLGGEINTGYGAKHCEAHELNYIVYSHCCMGLSLASGSLELQMIVSVCVTPSSSAFLKVCILTVGNTWSCVWESEFGLAFKPMIYTVSYFIAHWGHLLSPQLHYTSYMLPVTTIAIDIRIGLWLIEFHAEALEAIWTISRLPLTCLYIWQRLRVCEFVRYVIVYFSGKF